MAIESEPLITSPTEKEAPKAVSPKDTDMQDNASRRSSNTGNKATEKEEEEKLKKQKAKILAADSLSVKEK